MSTSSTAHNPLKDVEALTFDVFGTVVDWLTTGVRVLKAKAAERADLSSFSDSDWNEFIKEWRLGYAKRTVSAGLHGAGGSTLNVDIMHREILDQMLSSTRWAQLGQAWNEEDRHELVLLWHKLDGWADSSKALHELKKHVIIATLSNGNVRLLVDLAKHANLPWDIIFSGEFLGGFKPDPKVYKGAIHHLSVRPERCAMVAAHIYDLQFAAKHGMRTVYVRRPTEDTGSRDSVTAKDENGEGDVDVVVNGLEELAELVKSGKSA